MGAVRLFWRREAPLLAERRISSGGAACLCCRHGASRPAARLDQQPLSDGSGSRPAAGLGRRRVLACGASRPAPRLGGRCVSDGAASGPAPRPGRRRVSTGSASRSTARVSAGGSARRRGTSRHASAGDATRYSRRRTEPLPMEHLFTQPDAAVQDKLAGRTWPKMRNTTGKSGEAGLVFALALVWFRPGLLKSGIMINYATHCHQ